MRLLNLVEKDDRIWSAANGLRQLAALLIPDVAGRGAHQPRDGVLLAILTHVDAHERFLVVEKVLGERLREFRLSDASRAKEEEGTGRAVRV